MQETVRRMDKYVHGSSRRKKGKTGKTLSDRKENQN